MAIRPRRRGPAARGRRLVACHRSQSAGTRRVGILYLLWDFHRAADRDWTLGAIA
jgi:hypothetical protein